VSKGRTDQLTPNLTPRQAVLCRYCLQVGKFVKAHILPEAFFRRLWEGGTGPVMLTNKAGAFPKRAPVGVYDRGILCERCEPLFGPWDAYGQELLREDPGDWIQRTDGQRILAYERGDYDYPRLKLFVLSVLWRASVSTHSFYDRVRLGPHEERLRDILKSGAPGDADTYGVVLAKFVNATTRAILDPHPSRLNGLQYYQILLGSYTAYVKVDRRPALFPYCDIQLAPGRPLIVLGRDLRQAKELQILRDIVTAPQNSRPPR